MFRFTKVKNLNKNDYTRCKTKYSTSTCHLPECGLSRQGRLAGGWLANGGLNCALFSSCDGAADRLILTVFAFDGNGGTTVTWLVKNNP